MNTPCGREQTFWGFHFLESFSEILQIFLRHRFTIYFELGRRKLQGCTLAHRQISTPSLVEIGPRITKLWSIYICKKSKFLKFFRDSWKFSKTPVPKIKSAVWRPLATAFFLFYSVRFNPWLGALVGRKDVVLRLIIGTRFADFSMTKIWKKFINRTGVWDEEVI